MLDRTIAPDFQLLEDFKIQEAQTSTLSNGLKVHRLHQPLQPALKIELLFNKKPTDNPSVPYLAIKGLLEGTRKRSGAELKERLEQLGIFYDTLSGLDNSTLTFYLQLANMDEFLPLLEEILYESNFPEEGLSRLKRKKLDKLKVDDQKTGIVATRKFRHLLYDRHPYGQSIDAENLQGVDRAEVLDYYKEMQNAYELFLSGQVDENTLTGIEKTLASHKVAGLQFGTATTFKAPSSQRIDEDWKDKLQSSLRLGKRVPGPGSRQYFPLYIINELLGGFFGSRLMKNIREEKGLTYGIYSTIINLQEDSFWMIGADVNRDKKEEALTEIQKEINKLKEALADEEELEILQNYMQGSMVTALTNPFVLMDKFKSLYTQGLDYTHYHDLYQAIRSTRAEELQAAAKAYLNTENLSIISIG